uniref:Reverse transcriptase domain-containing protein n=1 Tax=Plectus sambesii TaxID=2011161 RepID=A0A914XTH4_9BILA
MLPQSPQSSSSPGSSPGLSTSSASSATAISGTSIAIGISPIIICSVNSATGIAISSSTSPIIAPSINCNVSSASGIAASSSSSSIIVPSVNCNISTVTSITSSTASSTAISPSASRTISRSPSYIADANTDSATEIITSSSSGPSSTTAAATARHSAATRATTVLTTTTARATTTRTTTTRATATTSTSARPRALTVPSTAAPATIRPLHSDSTAIPPLSSTRSNTTLESNRGRGYRPAAEPPPTTTRRHAPHPPDRAIVTASASAKQAAWATRFDAAANPTQLDATLAALIDEVHATEMTPVPRPPPGRDVAGPARQHHHRHSGPQHSAADAARIQRLYRINRPQAFRAVTCPPSPFCQIDRRKVHAHYLRVFGQSADTDMAMPPEVPPLPPPNSNDPLGTNFTTQEVWNRLQKCANTAPGPDGIRYSAWRLFDPGCYALTAVFNACHRLHHTPASWKNSTTILIHKNGDPDDISNWRPISLSDTAGKLYSACLAARLTKWCLENNRISTCQKGFLPYEGCVEHNFTLQTIIQDARRRRQRATIAWLDLRNAFGSVPHKTIFACLAWAGLSSTAINIIQRLYDGCSTRIRSAPGLTDSIPIKAGVKQGCPLSPIIFNLAVEPILRALANTNHGYMVQGLSTPVLAYADDLVLTSDSIHGLQCLLDITAKIATWAGLQFNAAKCASLHIEGSQHASLRTNFHIQDQAMKSLAITEFYKHLGVPTGFSTHHSGEQTIRSMAADIQKIDKSLLAPWQKFDAVNTFVLSRIAFSLKAGSVPKRPLTALDKQLKAAGKRWLSLPQRASAEPLYLPYRHGGMNLLPLSHLADIAQMVHALRLLTSNDPSTCKLASDALTTVVHKKIRRHPDPADSAAFLNGATDGIFCSESGDISSTWTRLRTATRRLCKKINLEWKCSNNSFDLLLDGHPVNRHSAESALRSALRAYYLHKLIAKPDQGKVFEVTAMTSAANHFMRAGNYTRFAEWRFVHRARLDVVALNGCRRFGPPGEKSCRRCNAANETLPHVLNHCPPNFTAITKRHNAILDRLTKAMRRPEAGSVLINQQLPGYDGRERPDIIILDDAKKTAFVADVTVAFENRQAAFSMARTEKHRKYEALAQHLRSQGYETAVDAFVIGSLGGYDSANAPTLNQLGIGHRYSILMKRLMRPSSVLILSTDRRRWRLHPHPYPHACLPRPTPSPNKPTLTPATRPLFLFYSTRLFRRPKACHDRRLQTDTPCRPVALNAPLRPLHYRVQHSRAHQPTRAPPVARAGPLAAPAADLSPTIPSLRRPLARRSSYLADLLRRPRSTINPTDVASHNLGLTPRRATHCARHSAAQLGLDTQRHFALYAQRYSTLYAQPCSRALRLAAHSLRPLRLTLSASRLYCARRLNARPVQHAAFDSRLLSTLVSPAEPRLPRSTRTTAPIAPDICLSAAARLLRLTPRRVAPIAPDFGSVFAMLCMSHLTFDVLDIPDLADVLRSTPRTVRHAVRVTLYNAYFG